MNDKLGMMKEPKPEVVLPKNCPLKDPRMVRYVHDLTEGIENCHRQVCTRIRLGLCHNVNCPFAYLPLPNPQNVAA